VFSKAKRRAYPRAVSKAACWAAASEAAKVAPWEGESGARQAVLKVIGWVDSWAASRGFSLADGKVAGSVAPWVFLRAAYWAGLLAVC